MPSDDFYTPTDTDSLRMENELLALEVRFLRGRFKAEYERSVARYESRLEDFERRLEESRGRLEESRGRLEESKGRLEESKGRLEESKGRLEESKGRLEESRRSGAQLRSRLVEAEQAEQDLVLLLTRLVNSPLHRFFRRRENFRNLERRYLNTDA